MSDDPSVPAPSVPRRWEAPCPNCGAAVPFAASTTPYAVCGYCRSTVVREGEALRKIGEAGQLIDSRSRLQLGVTGRWAGRGFTLIGRVQYGYGEGVASLDGSWNEWHALFDDGRSGWLSEDNDQYVFAFDRDDIDGAPPFGALAVGQRLRLAGSEWRVASIVHARPVAAEGELPKPPGIELPRPIVDLRNAQDQVATLDYRDDRTPDVAIGSSVRLAELALAGLIDGPDAGLATVDGRSFDCPACGAACTPKRQDTRSMSCGSCHAVIDLSKGAGADLQAYAQLERYTPAIPLGSIGPLAFAGRPAIHWQVIGYTVKRGREQDALPFTWRDYLLHNDSEGFAFLIDSDDGWVGYRTLTGVPEESRDGADVSWRHSRYRLVSRYLARVHYCEGEFYWAIRRDDELLTRDYEGTGAMSARRLSAEANDREVIWSEGSIIPADAVRKAFRIQEAAAAPGFVGGLDHDIGPFSGNGGDLVKYMLIGAAILIFLFVLNDEQRGMVVRAAGDAAVYGSYGGHK